MCTYGLFIYWYVEFARNSLCKKIVCLDNVERKTFKRLNNLHFMIHNSVKKYKFMLTVDDSQLCTLQLYIICI